MAEHRLVVIACFLIAAVARCAMAETYVETFEGGSNEGQWTWGTSGEVIEPDNGNPGAYLHAPYLDTYAPQPGTTPGVDSVFGGDFRARWVTAIGADLKTDYVDGTAAGRPLSLLLYTDNGTPDIPGDDWLGYTIGPENVPLEGEGWKTYRFAIPSRAASTPPPGWAIIELGMGSSREQSWTVLMSNITEVRFFYGDPTLYFIFATWNVGLDNPLIEEYQPLFADDFESGNVSAWSDAVGS
jgi:hypothetical protein